MTPEFTLKINRRRVVDRKATQHSKEDKRRLRAIVQCIKAFHAKKKREENNEQ